MLCCAVGLRPPSCWRLLGAPVSCDVGHGAEGVKGLRPAQCAGNAVHACRFKTKQHTQGRLKVSTLTMWCMCKGRPLCTASRPCWACKNTDGASISVWQLVCAGVSAICLLNQTATCLLNQSMGRAGVQGYWCLTDHCGLLCLQLVQQLLVACWVDIADQPAATRRTANGQHSSVWTGCCQIGPWNFARPEALQGFPCPFWHRLKRVRQLRPCQRRQGNPATLQGVQSCRRQHTPPKIHFCI